VRAVYFEINIPKVLATKALRPLWPGVVWSPASPTTVANLPEPALPGPRWIKVANRACGIDATDLSLLYVNADPSVAPAALPGNTRIYLGHEVVSTVTEVGAAVTAFQPGDRVIMDRSPLTGLSPNCFSQEIDPPCPFCARGDTALCENASAGVGLRGVGGGWGDGYTCHETEAYLCPPDISDDQAVLVEPMSVALRAVLRCPPKDTDKVLIVGAGILGLLMVQAVRAINPNCFLAVVARYPHQAEAARRFGANEIIGKGEQYATVARLTGGKHYPFTMNRGMVLGGFDVIYDCVGSGDSLTDSLRWARAGGTVVLVGIEFSFLKVDLNPVYYQEVNLIGSKGHGADDWHGQRRATFDRVIELLRAGQFRHDGLITHRFPLADLKRAVATFGAKATARPIKVLLEMPPR
jgi:threonine dehydrogenase-like Zn-dependent dehydrogenase